MDINKEKKKLAAQFEGSYPWFHHKEKNVAVQWLKANVDEVNGMQVWVDGKRDALLVGDTLPEDTIKAIRRAINAAQLRR